MTMFKRGDTPKKAKALSRVGLALWTVVVAIGGYAAKDFADFRGKQLEATASAVEQVVTTNDELTPLLVKFAKLALDEGTVTPEDKEQFVALLNKANDKALNLKNRIPDLIPLYEQYADSLVELRKSVDILKGSKTGKDFVKAVDHFEVASEDFKSAAEAARRSYIKSVMSQR